MPPDAPEGPSGSLLRGEQELMMELCAQSHGGDVPLTGESQSYGEGVFQSNDGCPSLMGGGVCIPIPWGKSQFQDGKSVTCECVSRPLTGGEEGGGGGQVSISYIGLQIPGWGLIP